MKILFWVYLSHLIPVFLLWSNQMIIPMFFYILQSFVLLLLESCVFFMWFKGHSLFPLLLPFNYPHPTLYYIKHILLQLINLDRPYIYIDKRSRVRFISSCSLRAVALVFVSYVFSTSSPSFSLRAYQTDKRRIFFKKNSIRKLFLKIILINFYIFSNI